MFKSARIKLTLWYLLIIMAISVSFSFVIYKFLSNEINRYARAQRVKIERRLLEGNFFPPGVHFQVPVAEIKIVDPELIDEARRRVITTLALINGGIFVISGGFGYLLAGRTLKPIKEMVDEQNRFITDASHELRTPLSSLKIGMEVAVRDTKLRLKEAKELSTGRIDEVNKLKSLTDELLQIAQYQKPNGNIKLQKFDPEEIISLAIKEIKPLAKEKNILIRKETEKTTCLADKESLRQLMVILLDNAIKYSPKDTTVIATSKKSKEGVVIMVSDQGYGIEEKDLKSIFNRFFRGRSENRPQGFGLGLSIAKRIVEINHGSIQVESEKNKGTTFNIMLPNAS